MEPFIRRKQPVFGIADFALHFAQRQVFIINIELLEKLLENAGLIIRVINGKGARIAQLFNILAGHMSVIGPRPALWNQEDLIALRDEYGANDVMPGLTGWAQINGRDELPLDVKARLDGEYARNISFAFDLKCFFGTVKSVLSHDGVVEGGTGQMDKEKDK